MTIVDLVLFVCSLTDPISCREQHLYRESKGSLQQCAVHAPTEIAKWSQENPAVRVLRWKCIFPDGSRHI